MGQGFIRSAILVGSMVVGSTVQAQTVKLPISEGVWVKTDTQCGAAYMVRVYAAGRFGDVYFYGPNQAMGPANETEVLIKTTPGKNGFTVVNEGPLEVSARPKGQAVVRAVSLSEGVQWSEPMKLCAPNALSPKMRAALLRLRLLPTPKRP
ncbi:hypothetical protein [Sphingobium subterraneum]|uniref:Uncharacterized protein n=1 Tax=Sphingobium subterraneum TaxID=627688 RepID=A0A841IYT5_9SPHN|nr:hypothetical protein [Sphingobium subterraneum]MBB6123757.1 hypothetical protein [Sphingobium subterraneum]